ncbi:MAG TPA: hypothetical protein VN767_26970 [Streptosporangiaceae bacterium]|nr:hypothetical protein [Streptosporangiaceae bacterium]
MAIAFTSATVAGLMLAPTAAFAASHSSMASHHAPAGNAQEGFDPDTTVTFAVTSGELTMTAPVAADLGSGAPGTDISGALGAVSVQDNRALLTASWVVSASSTNYTTGTATPNETIPATDIDYAPGTITKSGTITVTGTGITMSNSPQTVVTGSSGVGDNSASWDPTITVHVPAAAVFGTYTGTIAHSVS